MADICQLFADYERAARDSFDAAFVSKEHLLSLAKEAQLSAENQQFLADFMDGADEQTKRFIWQFYYLLYCTGEDFYRDHWQLDNLPMPEAAEKKCFGGIKAVVFLLAAENLKKWLRERNLSDDMLDNFYGRYREVVRLNLIDHETFGLSRLIAFLYGYSKPYILHATRLNFQRTLYKDYCEMYENERGGRLFVALPTHGYDKNGLRDDSGEKPSYEKKGDLLMAHTFDEKGRLKPQAETIDLTQYHLALQPGDEVWTIHIPGGKKLDMQEVCDSIRQANGMIKQFFPPHKGFVCHTWFIDPGLRGKVIKEGSNMAAFADLFDVISGPDNENHSVFEHVFMVKRQPLENLIPQNSFQQRVLNNALSGGKIYWSYGVLKKDFPFEEARQAD